jgi:hypothetical protein
VCQRSSGVVGRREMRPEPSLAEICFLSSFIVVLFDLKPQETSRVKREVDETVSLASTVPVTLLTSTGYHELFHKGIANI